MDRGQPIGIDKYLMHIRAVGIQGINQFVGRGAVEISIKAKMDTVPVFKLEYFKVHGHRLPSFLPP
jgi:hypothetical protein